MSGQGYDDDLAYGSYRGQRPAEEDGQTGDRGLIGDIYNNLRGRRPQHDQQVYLWMYCKLHGLLMAFIRMSLNSTSLSSTGKVNNQHSLKHPYMLQLHRAVDHQAHKIRALQVEEEAPFLSVKSKMPCIVLGHRSRPE